MAEHATTAVAEVPAHGIDSAHGEVNLFKPDALIMGLTWLTFLLTTVPRDTASDVVLAELYRVRWQIEIAFKRLKSLAHLDDLRARSPELARVDLLSKLIAAVLVDLIARQMRAFSPWGYPIDDTGQPLAAHPSAPGGDLELHARRHQNSGTSCWSTRATARIRGGATSRSPTSAPQ